MQVQFLKRSTHAVLQSHLQRWLIPSSVSGFNVKVFHVWRPSCKNHCSSLNMSWLDINSIWCYISAFSMFSFSLTALRRSEEISAVILNKNGCRKKLGSFCKLNFSICWNIATYKAYIVFCGTFSIVLLYSCCFICLLFLQQKELTPHHHQHHLSVTELVWENLHKQLTAYYQSWTSKSNENTSLRSYTF